MAVDGADMRGVLGGGQRGEFVLLQGAQQVGRLNLATQLVKDTGEVVTVEVLLAGALRRRPAVVLLVEQHPRLAANALQTVGSRLQETHARVVELSTQQVESRIAHALLRLAKQAGRPIPEGVEIDFPISRQDVAEMTGTTLHTVSRTLSGWEAKGLIDGGRQRIVLRRDMAWAEEQGDTALLRDLRRSGAWEPVGLLDDGVPTIERALR